MPEQVVRQRSRGFICVNAHPLGCAQVVESQIASTRRALEGTQAADLRNVLVIGASTGYGLATRIAAGWGLGCRTLGVFLEKPPARRRTASAGYYNSVALHAAASRDGMWARSVNGDAFSDGVKDQVCRIVAGDMGGQVDLVVYSVAAPRRSNPRTGTVHTSSLKPIGRSYSGKTIDLGRSSVTNATVPPARQTEIDDTVAVMGGQDWRWWIEALLARGLLASGARTVSYSYEGPELTWPIYKHGTIGAAKRDLRATADLLNSMLAHRVGGGAWISVNKAVVTQASSAIPVVPLYVSLLFRVMKSIGIHESCIDQANRLFAGHLCRPGGPRVDSRRMIRLDDLEMREDVQAAVSESWPRVDTESLNDLTDFAGFRRDFNQLFGFDVPRVDYAKAVETQLTVPAVR